jgi:hypothetical protein
MTGHCVGKASALQGQCATVNSVKIKAVCRACQFAGVVAHLRAESKIVLSKRRQFARQSITHGRALRRAEQCPRQVIVGREVFREMMCAGKAGRRAWQCTKQGRPIRRTRLLGGEGSIQDTALGSACSPRASAMRKIFHYA